MTSSDTTATYSYNADGLRIKKTVDGVVHNYVYSGGKLVEETYGDTKLNFSYDANGNPYTFSYTKGNNSPSVYHYVLNLQGDVVRIVTNKGVTRVTYEYDAWGNITNMTYTNETLANANPLRYRGYYYDRETGLYYLQSRYYNPKIGRWISPEPNVYAGKYDIGSRLLGYNVYSYCANNPVNFADPSGECILTALLIGVIAGAVVGGAIGGTVAYNAASSSGLVGSDLFWATTSGVGKGALIGGVAGGLAGTTGGVVATYGAASIAGTAMITTTATITARATEITVLQARKSINDGDNGWQTANDCIDSVVCNGGKVVAPLLTKTATTSVVYVATDVIANKVVSPGFSAYLQTAGRKALPYGMAACAWGYAVYAGICPDPVSTANQRGYILK